MHYPLFYGNIKYINIVDGPFALLRQSILLWDINFIKDLFDDKRAQAKTLSVCSLQTSYEFCLKAFSMKDTRSLVSGDLKGNTNVLKVCGGVKFLSYTAKQGISEHKRFCMACVHRPNSPYNGSLLYLLPCSNCFHFLAHPHLRRSSQPTFRFMPLFASSPWTPTEACYTFGMWVPNGGCVPDTSTSQFHSASSLDFRESQVPARGFQCGTYTAHLT